MCRRGFSPGRVFMRVVLVDPNFRSATHVAQLLEARHHEVKTFADGRDALLTVGEMPGVSVEEALLTTDPARGELNMVFQFEHVGLDHGTSKFDPRPLAPGVLADSLTRWQEALGETGWNSLYLSNHDQPRSVSRFGNDRDYWRESATALATMLHLGAVLPNLTFAADAHYHHLMDDIIVGGKLPYCQGTIEVPTAPGGRIASGSLLPGMPEVGSGWLSWWP